MLDCSCMDELMCVSFARASLLAFMVRSELRSLSSFPGFSKHVRCPGAMKPPVTKVLALKPWATSQTVAQTVFRQCSVRDLRTLITLHC